MAIKTNLDSSAIAPPVAVQRLPSLGWPYREEYPSFKEEIRIKPFSFNTHSILITNLPIEEKMREILKEVAEFDPPEFDLSKLLVSDQYFILAVARSLTFGEQYSFTVTCEACGHQETPAIKVPEEVPILWWNFKTKAEWEKHLTVTLPICKDKVRLKYPTVLSDSQVTEITKAALKADPSSDGRIAYLNRIAAQIDTVNNSIPTLDEARNYVRRIFGLDYDTLNEAFDEKRSGIVYLYKIECDRCKHHYEAEIPIRDQFFRRK